MKNWSYTITEGEHKGKTIWSGRYCAVCAIVIVHKKIKVTDKLYKQDKYFLLVSKRGKGTPNYQGCWNIQCGFLDGDEKLIEACSRETYEETGVTIDPSEFKLWQISDDTSIDQNVTVRYIAKLSDFPHNNEGYKGEGGEENEVDEVMWLDLSDKELIDKMEWAFNHHLIVEELAKKYK